jgi:RecB family exonuclease
VITPRVTRLVRVESLQAFRDAASSLAVCGSPLDARDRLVVVPTHAAAEHLVRTIEAARPRAVILPDFATVSELVRRFAERLPVPPQELTPEEREALLRVACRAVVAAGIQPPFRVRPGLIAEMLRFYDDLRRNQKDVETFERLALGMLEPGAADDRGARQLVEQTRFLAAAFRDFERRSAPCGADEHELRHRVLASPATRPFKHLVVTVTDRSVDSHGFASADWDLLARVPAVERVDVLVTDRRLAGALHERLHTVLPGIEEMRFDPAEPERKAVVVVPDADSRVFMARDREDEVGTFARRVKAAFRDGHLTSLDRAALVVRQPLPYVYLARTVLRSAGIPCQFFDTLPLAAEPFAAALDLALTFASSGFARVPGIQLLQSPHFSFLPANALSTRDVNALDRALTESGYAGDLESLDRLLDSWSAAEDSTRRPRALRAAAVFHSAAQKLAPLRRAAPVADHLSVLLEFLEQHHRVPTEGQARSRQLRARAAVRATITSLRDAHRRFDDAAVEIDEIASLLRRWIEGQTFAPRTGDTGVHIVDSVSAPFGTFDYLQLAGLVDGEWPERPRRNIFYSTAILRELGWPAESDRSDGIRVSFGDLLRSPGSEVAVSGFLLEHDTIVTVSPLLDEIEPTTERPLRPVAIFGDEALTQECVDLSSVAAEAREWAAFRARSVASSDGRFSGLTDRHEANGFSLSALERYQDCPFKFFAAEVLRLEEPPDDGSTLSPRTRGRLVHDLLHRFFLAWDARGEGAITPGKLETARTLFVEIAEPLLAKLPPTDAALERTRLFGSALSVGVADAILRLEATRPDSVGERWLEYRLEGSFSLGVVDGRRLPLRGVADRIDLLDGNRLRVIDYKTGSAPERGRALQGPIYALCAQERLTERTGQPWGVDEALYISFAGKRAVVRVARDGGDLDTLTAARDRVFALIDRISAGEFQPRPHDPMICSYCAYSTVCRKDYVE